VLEIGATVPLPIVNAAAASAIASNVFMSAPFLIVDDKDDPYLKRDRPRPSVLVCNGMKQL
jgi:hypothetical protein